MKSATANKGKKQDILIADFEGDDFQGWNVVGDAFGNGPQEIEDGKPGILGVHGRKIASSLVGKGGIVGEQHKGTLTSHEFLVERNYITFLIAGGKREVKGPCVKLLLDGKIKRVATAFNNKEMQEWIWDVKNLKGQKVQIQLHDSTLTHKPSHWGYIAADHFVQTDHPSVNLDPIARAMQAVEKAVPLAKKDLNRPVYHFRPPAQWMNDINGSIYFNGYYHIFYQHNPYADTWECMHWGHARSKDLVHWEHQPIALAPSYELGEEQIFSGSAAINEDGYPMLFYTSIKQDQINECREEWAAISYDNMVSWKKLGQNPVVAHTYKGEQFSAQDPFVFNHEGNSWLISTSFNGKNPLGGFHLYKSRNGKLDDWEYKGSFLEKGSFCPNLVKLGDKWVLFEGFNQHLGEVDWDNYLFLKEKTSPIAYSNRNALSSNLITNGPKKRQLFTCWLTRRKNYDLTGRGWAGCMSLPQELYIGEEGGLARKPVEELKKLRSEMIVEPSFKLKKGVKDLQKISGHTLEIETSFKPSVSGNSGMMLRRSADGGSFVSIRYNDGEIYIEGHGENTIKVPISLKADGSVSLHIFLDRSIFEMYINDGLYYAVAYMHNDLGDVGTAFFSDDGEMEVLNVEAWQINPIW